MEPRWREQFYPLIIYNPIWRITNNSTQTKILPQCRTWGDSKAFVADLEAGSAEVSFRQTSQPTENGEWIWMNREAKTCTWWLRLWTVWGIPITWPQARDLNLVLMFREWTVWLQNWQKWGTTNQKPVSVFMDFQCSTRVWGNYPNWQICIVQTGWNQQPTRGENMRK